MIKANKNHSVPLASAGVPNETVEHSRYFQAKKLW